MAAQTKAGTAAPAFSMSVFERYLTVWVLLCIVAGIALGLLTWVMVIPMLLKVDFGALGQVRQHWRGIGVTLFVNWAVKPFSMALLAWSATSSPTGCRPTSSTATSPG